MKLNSQVSETGSESPADICDLALCRAATTSERQRMPEQAHVLVCTRGWFQPYIIPEPALTHARQEERHFVERQECRNVTGVKDALPVVLKYGWNGQRIVRARTTPQGEVRRYERGLLLHFAEPNVSVGRQTFARKWGTNCADVRRAC
jgi:YD repeat-containing protein